MKSYSSFSPPSSIRRSSRRFLTILLLWSSLAVGARSEAGWLASGNMDFVLSPDSNHIHYTSIHLEAPGFIDLSALSFVAIGKGSLTETRKDTKMDIVVAPLNDTCSTPDYKEGVEPCRLFDAGLGRNYSPKLKGRLPEIHWCCSDKEAALGLCEGGSKYGRLMIDHKEFKGNLQTLNVPPSGPLKDSLKGRGKIEDLQQSGTYAVIFANCFEGRGRPVSIKGKIKVSSSTERKPFKLVGNLDMHTLPREAPKKAPKEELIQWKRPATAPPTNEPKEERTESLTTPLKSTSLRRFILTILIFSVAFVGWKHGAGRLWANARRTSLGYLAVQKRLDKETLPIMDSDSDSAEDEEDWSE